MHKDYITLLARFKKYLIKHEDLKRVSPLMLKHPIAHGTYDFKAAIEGGLIMRPIDLT
jgi:hypothetical protein